MNLEPTITTWVIAAFGIITILGLLYAQLLLILNPRGQKARDLLIGKGEEWRDKSHFRYSYGFAIVDWTIWMPLMISGTIGVLMSQSWGYALWGASGVISFYVNIVLWFAEREYVYPSCGPLTYYTYYWGFFIYWGLLCIVYSALRLSGVSF